MTPSSFRVRLALALGLPACAHAVSPPPTTPPTTPPPAVVPGDALPVIADDGLASTTNVDHGMPPLTGKLPAPTRAGIDGMCMPERVHERVCGYLELDNTAPKAGAPAPRAHCPASATALEHFDSNSIIDGWLVNEGDPSLASFHYDPATSATFEVTSGIRDDVPRCCYDRCAALPVIETPRTALPAGKHAYESCLPKPDRTDHAAASAPGCSAALKIRLRYPYGAIDPLDDAPFVREADDACCYMVATAHGCPPNTFEQADGSCEEPNPGGRPLYDARAAVVVAPPRARADWSTAIPAADAHDGAAAAEARDRAAAAAWAREAAFEHASIAAFGHLALDLLAHGAPPELVDAAHAAARDEIAHARTAYAIASAFAGEPIGPGRLAVPPHAPAATLADLALACFRDGCVNETVAALGVAEAARRAGSPALAAQLAQIADDEARHAELSFQIVAWALAADRATVGPRLAAEVAALATAPSPIDPAITDLERAGILSARTAAAVRATTIATAIIPTTLTLLAS